MRPLISFLMMTLFSTGTAATAWADTNLDVISSAEADPLAHKATIKIRSRVTYDLRCDMKITGIVRGHVNGQVVANRYDSEPVVGYILKAGRTQERDFDFWPSVWRARGKWQDDYAIIAEIDQNSLVTACVRAEQSGGGNDPNIQANAQIFRNQRSSKCLNLQMPTLNAASSRHDGVPVMQWDCEPYSEWRNNYWGTYKNPDGTYLIYNEFSGHCLSDTSTLAGGNPSDWAALVQFNCNAAGGRSRYWIVNTGDGYYKLQVAQTNLCVTVDTQNGGYANYDRTVLRGCDTLGGDNNAQRWKLQPAH